MFSTQEEHADIAMFILADYLDSQIHTGLNCIGK
jgi:hypothetical protein